MTATSASVQRKGQWFRLDARQFSRQLENNTMKAHGIHAAGTEALPTGTSREDVTVEGRRTPHSPARQRLVTALHSSSSLHCTVKVCHPVCHCALLMSPSQYQEFLSAYMLLSHTPGCASCWAWGLCHLYAGVGRAVRHCAGTWSGCWVSLSHHVPSAPPCFR